MEEKKRINAAISYLFMWELFLLAKNNPAFGDVFVRNHAKNATKIHLIFLILILIYKKFIEIFLYIPIPIISINISRIVETCLYIIFTLLLIRWAYRAFYWVSANDIKIRKDYFKITEDALEDNLSETNKIIYLCSYIPFIGLIIWNKHESIITKYWMKIWWLFSLILLILISTKHSDLVLIITLLYTIFVVFIWVIIFTQQKIIFSELVNHIYDLNKFYSISRALFKYIIESVIVVFGWKKELNFTNTHNKIIENDSKYFTLTNEYLTDNNIVFWNKLIFIPIINIIYFPTLLFNKKSRYIIAITQWLIITVISILLWYFDYSDYSIWLLFPIFLWTANIKNNPYYRIPIIFEIYQILDKLTFWIFSKIKFLKEKKKEIQEVRIKI